MKLLYVAAAAPDYLADQLYVGLCRVLGVSAVIDYPWKGVYHDPDRRLAYLPQVVTSRYGQDDIVSLVRDRKIDLMVLSSPRASEEPLADELSQMAECPPCVLVDGEDDSRIRHEVVERFRCRLYFKREYRWHPASSLKGRLDRWKSFRKNPWLFERTFPLQFSAIRTVKLEEERRTRDVDISFAARISHPKRLRAWTLLHQTEGIKVEGSLYAEATDRQSKLASGLPRLLIKLRGDPRVTVAQRGTRLGFEEYHDLLARSKIALSIRGGGFDTVRYWEIVASKALLVSEEPDICIPHNFEHGKHAVFCKSDLSDLMDLVKAFTWDDAAREGLAEEGYRHLLRHHTCERRAEYFLDLCRRYI
ncbi:hypothetical protein YTPLAS18_25350 [Nitrospira sp.]|nr:hypothetical protein YTPLAS18_25350 [Nitrospira sp.]